MPAAMTALATITLGSAASSVTFGSIPATYRDLRLVVEGTTSAGPSILVRYNSDTGSNYSHIVAYGSGSSPSTGSGTGSGTSVEFGYNILAERFSITADVLDYSATDKHKTNLSRSNQPSGSNQIVLMYAGRWASTSAVTSLTVLTSTGNFAIGTTLSLYGILA
jgi:hypothetical protein